MNNLRRNISVTGWDFKLVEATSTNDWFYQCRGPVMYDDEHYEMPDPSLWRAAKKLESILSEEGLKVYAEHSEKGWVEVILNI